MSNDDIAPQRSDTPSVSDNVEYSAAALASGEGYDVRDFTNLLYSYYVLYKNGEKSLSEFLREPDETGKVSENSADQKTKYNQDHPSRLS